MATQIIDQHACTDCGTQRPTPWTGWGVVFNGTEELDELCPNCFDSRMALRELQEGTV